MKSNQIDRNKTVTRKRYLARKMGSRAFMTISLIAAVVFVGCNRNEKPKILAPSDLVPFLNNYETLTHSESETGMIQFIFIDQDYQSVSNQISAALTESGINSQNRLLESDGRKSVHSGLLRYQVDCIFSYTIYDGRRNPRKITEGSDYGQACTVMFTTTIDDGTFDDVK